MSNNDNTTVRIRRVDHSIITAQLHQLNFGARNFWHEQYRRSQRHPSALDECKFGDRCNATGGRCTYVHFPLGAPAANTRLEVPAIQPATIVPDLWRPSSPPAPSNISNATRINAPTLVTPASAAANTRSSSVTKKKSDDTIDAAHENDVNYVSVQRANTTHVEYIHIDRIDGRTVGGASLKLKHADYARAYRRYESSREQRLSLWFEEDAHIWRESRPAKPDVVRECKAFAENQECVVRSCANIHLLPPPSDAAVANNNTQEQEDAKKNALLITPSTSTASKEVKWRTCDKIAPAYEICMFCSEDLSDILPPRPMANKNDDNNNKKAATPNSNDDDDDDGNAQQQSGNINNNQNDDLQPLIVFQEKFVCARGHSICSTCITRYINEMWSLRSSAVKNESRSASAAADPSVPTVLEVPQLFCLEADCDTPALTPAQVAKTVNEDSAIDAFIETQQRAREAITLQKANDRVREILQAKGKAEADAMARKLADESVARTLDRSKTFMCPKCNCMVILDNCNDLRTHHSEIRESSEAFGGQRLQEGGMYHVDPYGRLVRQNVAARAPTTSTSNARPTASIINNSCPGCGFYAENISSWLRWDGIMRTDAETLKIPRQADEAADRRHAGGDFAEMQRQNELDILRMFLRDPMIPHGRMFGFDGHHHHHHHHDGIEDINARLREQIERQREQLEQTRLIMETRRRQHELEQRRELEAQRREQQEVRAAQEFFVNHRSGDNRTQETAEERDRRLAMELFAEMNGMGVPAVRGIHRPVVENNNNNISTVTRNVVTPPDTPVFAPANRTNPIVVAAARRDVAVQPQMSTTNNNNNNAVRTQHNPYAFIRTVELLPVQQQEEGQEQQNTESSSRSFIPAMLRGRGRGGNRGF